MFGLPAATLLQNSCLPAVRVENSQTAYASVESYSAKSFQADNLSGFSQAIAACYPQTEIQKCIIHQIRSSTRYVSYKDIKKVTAD